MLNSFCLSKLLFQDRKEKSRPEVNRNEKSSVFRPPSNPLDCNIPSDPSGPACSYTNVCPRSYIGQIRRLVTIRLAEHFKESLFSKKSDRRLQNPSWQLNFFTFFTSNTENTYSS